PLASSSAAFMSGVVESMTTSDMKAALLEANGGERVDVVLEMVGGSTFDGSLAALAPFGRLVTYGTASRELPTPVEPRKLVHGTKAVVGFWLAHCFTRQDFLHPQMRELFDLTLAGKLRPIVGATYPLADARLAHESLRSRGSVGKLLLDPTV
ncbi:MAG TPA: zinc-binding dehydrogenase, partial [Egibacteraceae bacterium]|nr:zinc-binding dehydrogenase [Egibacteraceae bacterium]